MTIGQTLYCPDRASFRQWLMDNHNTQQEIWLQFFTKSSGKPRISYREAVEEALCFGWIDSSIKRIDSLHSVQKFSRRKPKSNWSQTNTELARQLMDKGLMTPAGAAVLPDMKVEPLHIQEDILDKLQASAVAWQNWQNFDDTYKRVRIAFVEDVRKKAPKIFVSRLNNLIRQTEKNKKFGFIT